MDRRGGCCIARYGGGGGGGGVYDVSKVNRILLRYRPIAPKPAVGGSACEDLAGKESTVRSGRGRRKGGQNSNAGKKNNIVGGKNGGASRSCGRKRKVSEIQSTTHPAASVVTLPLLPETPDRKGSPSRGSSSSSENPVAEVVGAAAAMKSAPIWLNFGNDNITGSHVTGHVAGGGGDLVYMLQRQPVMKRVVVASWVKVESVSDTWVDEYGLLGCTDEERVMNLHEDTCPGFISNCANRVTWANAAYRQMVARSSGGGGDMEETEVAVWLVVRDGVELPTRSRNRAAFTCQVSVVTCGGKSTATVTLPCDVWRLESGGFAWRLDVKAALCLGR